MALDAKVKVSGGELDFGQYLNKALVNAEDEAKAMGDEYVSVEHLFLALLKYPSPSMKKICSANLALQGTLSCRHFLQYVAISVWSATIRKLLMIL